MAAGVALDPVAAAAVMRAADLDPLEDYRSTSTPWLCRCLTCDREVRPRYADVNRGHLGCRSCGYAKVGSNQRRDPDVAADIMRTVGFEPLEPYGAAHAPWRCRCLTCGRVTSPQLVNVERGAQCAWCSGHNVDPVEAADVMRSAGLEPLDAYPGSAARWSCVCGRCHRTVATTYATVRSGHTGCRRCAAALARLPERPAMAARAEAVMRAANLEPLTEYPGAVQPWLCRCVTCGLTVRPRYNAISNGQGGCSPCGMSKYHVFPESPAFLYLVTHRTLNAHKVGIRSALARYLRTEKHGRYGWEVYKEMQFDRGRYAYAVEQAVLRWLRNDLGLPYCLTSSDIPTGGYTETVSADSVALPALWDKALDLRGASVWNSL